MMVIGDTSARERVAHRLAGSAAFAVATAEPYRVEFDGWELAEHPWPVYQRTDAYRIVVSCARVFLFRCAWRDSETWHLPAPTAILTPTRGSGPFGAWLYERPYVSLSWCRDGATVRGRAARRRSHVGASVDFVASDMAAATAGDFAFGGDTIFRLAAAAHGAGLDGLIPTGAMHDLIVFGTAWNRVAKKGNTKSVTAANRRLWCIANIFGVADGREEV